MSCASSRPLPHCSSAPLSCGPTRPPRRSPPPLSSTTSTSSSTRRSALACGATEGWLVRTREHRGGPLSTARVQPRVLDAPAAQHGALQHCTARCSAAADRVNNVERAVLDASAMGALRGVHTVSVAAAFLATESQVQAQAALCTKPFKRTTHETDGAAPLSDALSDAPLSLGPSSVVRGLRSTQHARSHAARVAPIVTGRCGLCRTSRSSSPGTFASSHAPRRARPRPPTQRRRCSRRCSRRRRRRRRRSMKLLWPDRQSRAWWRQLVAKRS